MNSQLFNQLGSITTNPVRVDCQLAEYTSFRIGGPAKAVVEADSENELSAVLHLLHQHQLKWRVIGRGTNLLVRDEGFDGVIILLGGVLKEWTVAESGLDVKISVGAGCGLSKLAYQCAEKGFSGLEFASGIPASVGGGVVMNAGAWGRSMSDVICGVTVVSSDETKYLNGSGLKFEYRRWTGMDSMSPCVVTMVDLQLQKSTAHDVSAVCSKYRELRKEKQPVGQANAGSFFKNPDGDSAGRLIDASGFKGKSVGDAVVSPKHANFILNRENATAADVLELIEKIQKKVFEDSGVQLQPEVHVL